jgi:hypothetical protein
MNLLSNLWLGWAIVNAIAGAITGALEEGGFQFAATLLFSGILAGIGQGWWLRRCQIPIRWWAIATVLGWIGGQFLKIALRDNLPILYGQAFFYFIPSVGMAIAQSMVAPIARFSWIGMSALGGIANALVSSAICAAICRPILMAVPGHFTVILTTAMTYGGGWFAYGLVTGTVLQRFVRNSTLD